MKNDIMVDFNQQLPKKVIMNIFEQEGMTFDDHDYAIHSPFHLQSLGGKIKGGNITKVVVKSHAFLLDHVYFFYNIYFKFRIHGSNFISITLLSRTLCFNKNDKYHLPTSNNLCTFSIQSHTPGFKDELFLNMQIPLRLSFVIR